MEVPLVGMSSVQLPRDVVDDEDHETKNKSRVIDIIRGSMSEYQEMHNHEVHGSLLLTPVVTLRGDLDIHFGFEYFVWTGVC